MGRNAGKTMNGIWAPDYSGAAESYRKECWNRVNKLPVREMGYMEQRRFLSMEYLKSKQ